jgi:DNA repair exonuclease SbcCD ATPase subunit
MIIKQIQAENVLKYARLQLTNLPTRGLIAISGPNESGKTSIAEIICLALFGRTFSLEPHELTKSIKWGEFHGSVALEFTGKEGHDYTVARNFDGDGSHSARLSRSGEHTFIARGVEAVTQAAVQLGGFSYERFIDSFYLAQRNIATPHALRGIVKALAGVETLDKISTELAQDISKAQDSLPQLDGQIADTGRQLAELNIQDTTLSQLHNERQSQLEGIAKNEVEITKLQTVSAALLTATAHLAERVDRVVGTGVDTPWARWQDHARHLDEALGAFNEVRRSTDAGTGPDETRELKAWLDDFRSRLQELGKVRELTASYQEHLARLLGIAEKSVANPADSARSLSEQEAGLNKQLNTFIRRQTRALLGFGITLLGALASWGAWWLLRFASDSRLAQWLVNTLGMGDPSRMPMVLAAGVGFGVVCLVFLVRSLALASRVVDTRQELIRLNRQAESARNEAQALDNLAALPLPNELGTLRQLKDPQLSAALSTFATGPGAPLLDAEALAAYLAKLQTAASACENSVRATRGRLDNQIREAKTRIDRHQQEVPRLNREIVEEQARHEKAEQLNQQTRALRDRMDEHKQQIKIRHIAEKLLDGTRNRFYARFNLEMRHVIGKIMLRLTEGRYQNLQVDEDLEIQVFSNEKGNFVGLNEISGGTYHQLMLAIRLALSQALISSSIDGVQFIILDEPFAFFDEQRTRRTLNALPRISEEISQVWVISPQLDTDTEFDLHLRCTYDNDTLVTSGA